MNKSKTNGPAKNKYSLLKNRFFVKKAFVSL